MLNITDLTKDELLQVISDRGLTRSINLSDIKRVRWRTMTNQAKQLMDEACNEIVKYKGPDNFTKWMEANRKFDKAMKLYEDADRFIDEKE